jgi:hypothetical protein
VGKADKDVIGDAEKWRSLRPRRGSKVCWGCSIPQAEIINELRRRGWGPTDVQDYLIEKHGYAITDATRNRIHHHFNQRHHEVK